MRKPLFVAALLFAPLAVAAPMPRQAPANVVKSGVDAWSRGEYRKAVELWRAPAVAGDADAQFNLGQAYKLGRGVPTDLGLAEDWYRKAALQGHRQAEDNYGLALFQNNKRSEAVKWLEKSVARGEPRAQFVLGTMLFNGDVVQKDWVRAYALMVRANATGLPQAASSLAQMDRYVGLQERQQGLALAKRYESEAGRPALAAAPTPPAATTVASADLPPARNAQPVAERPAPVPRPAAPKPAAVRAEPKAVPARRDGGWRVQLGAFRDAGNARDQWGKAARSLPGAQPFYVKAGAITRLLAGPYGSSAEAAKACAAVKRAGIACLPVKG
ncbi:sporulation protein [Sphingomonas spermidinifaciens]|uniref:Sporulation protein n=1 Tax=Sphingomonas spermidinifaciens TaxID=1141889 RepID=A0A2A4B4Y6_9SPHN|nr:SPOR domain-containing protein [Sphingomonas spermidinifaciens]PCD03140.1 sporulation protein [Sphingomonas spermidinifaciens]